MVRTRAFQEPLGAWTSTTSPTAAPRSAEPSGESGETPPTAEISREPHDAADGTRFAYVEYRRHDVTG